MGQHTEVALTSPTVIFRLVISGLTSVILIVLNIIFSSRLLFSLELVLRIVAAYVVTYGVVIM